MIKNIIELMQVDEFYGKSETIDIAKGENELTFNLKKMYKQKLRRWLRKR